MAVPTTNAITGPYTTNGVTVTFPFDFTAPTAAEVDAKLVDADGTETTLFDYAVTLGAISGGSITFQSPPEAGYSLYVLLDPDFRQQIEFEDGSPWQAAPHNEGYDRAAARDQSLKRDLDRAVTVPTGETGLALPSSDARADKALFFDSAGTPSAISVDDFAAPAQLAAADSEAFALLLSTVLAGYRYSSLAEGQADPDIPLGGVFFVIESGRIYWGQKGVSVATKIAEFLTKGNFSVSNRTALSALSPAVSDVATLTETGREGVFQFDASDCSSDVTADPQQGLTVAPLDDPTGASGVWRRLREVPDTGRPEWFNVVPGVSTGAVPTTNLANLQACIAVCPVIQFSTADYYFSDTVQLATSFRTYKGTTAAWDATGKGARLLSTNAAKDVVRVSGTDIYLENLCAMHAVPLVAATWTANKPTAPKSWLFQNTVSVEAHRLSAFNPLIGFFFDATIAKKVYDCRAYRDASYGSGDFFYGFWAYDDGTHPGLAGGNGSLHLFGCNATGGGGLARSGVGLVATGDFADLFVQWFETSAVPLGILLDGTGGTYSGGHGDVRIAHPTIDQCTWGGIEITHINSLGKIQINGGYVQANDLGAGQKALLFKDGGGYLSVTGLQVTGTAGATTSIGCQVDNYPNVVLDPGTMIENYAFPVNVLNGSTRYNIQCQIQAGQINSAGTRPAITVTGSGEGRIAATIAGSSGAFSEGVNLVGAGNSRTQVDLTLVDPGAIADVRKLVVNAVKITGVGYFKSDGTSGGHTDNGIQVLGFAT